MQSTELGQKGKGNRKEEKQPFQQMIFEQLNIYIHRNYLDTDQIHFMKNNSQLIMNLKVKCKIIKLEDTIRENLHALGYDDIFLATTSKMQSIKEIINKLDFMKIKKLLLQKKHYVRELEANQTGRKYLKKTCPINNCYTKFIYTKGS